MQHVRRLLTVVLVLAVLASIPVFWASAQDGGQVTHTVQAGENLYRIAKQYGTTVTAIAQANNITNPNLIRVGQVLAIPGVSPAPDTTPVPGTTPTATSPATPAPSAGGTVHIVQPGENLFRIALRYNLLTTIVAAYNNLENPGMIYVGQEIRIPPAGYTMAQPQPTPVPEATAVPAVELTITPPPSEAANVGFAYGVYVQLPNQDMASVIQKTDDLGVTWVKQYVDWALYEASPGNINWVPLDEMVDAIDNAGFNILLTVSSAPSWARDTNVDKGPPTDYQTYANFVGELAARYEGRVDAYEIWNEPNLQREWHTPKGLSAENYVALLKLAYAAIKQADPQAIVMSGGLAPTGINDPAYAIDDRVFFSQMYAAGVAEWADAIGAHPNGWANPPDSTCCQNNRPAVSGWDDHPSFFFKETLRAYRDIMKQNGDSGTYIWATEFGWGSNDGLNIEPPEGLGFVAFTSLDEQAQYILRAYQLGREMGYVGPMFLSNLNYCQVVGVSGEQCFWSLLDPAGNPRPAYLALKDALD
jgi:LysM repeat protein